MLWRHYVNIILVIKINKTEVGFLENEFGFAEINYVFASISEIHGKLHFTTGRIVV